MTPEDSAFASAGVISGRLAVPASHSRIAMALLALLLASLAVQVLGVLHRNINWDEFLFLSTIYRVANGETVGLLQTPYAHLFRWLTRIGGDEITQIAVARALFLIVWAGSLALLYALARRLLDPLGALAGVALFALFSYSVTHAASFRIDGLLLPVLLAVALFLLKPTTGRVAAAGALSGVALALTIKASLWAPAFAGVLVVGLWHEQHRFKPVLAGAVAAIVTFAGLMLAHSWWLTADNGPAPTVSSDGLKETGFRMLLEDGFLPRSDVLGLAVMQNPVTSILVLAGLVLTIAEVRRAAVRRRALVLLLLALPMLSVALYANAWPYAYIVLMPTACLMAGHAFSRFVCGGDMARVAAWGVCVLAALPMVASAWTLRLDQQEHQKQVLAIVHTLFNEPVAYIDKGGMIPSFPMQPVFLSRWGMKNYREANVPVFARYVREAHPPLVIVNTPILEVWDESMLERIEPRFRLLAEDVEALRAAYAPYWGAIYLAGRQWRDLGEAESVSFAIVIASDYTLVSRGS
ncbi:MAG TPA: glycosyltransferase family 39 protein, partial [Aestuariivirgaceae bacterium]|nr:glycosyltransferase family 39 protein [Aestuariivirgaceae bacterium]